MLERVSGVAAMVAVLAVPFLLRPRDDLLDAAGEPLVIVTPHNEAVRYEFARAFREHERAHGHNVRIDWRTPGGTTEIARFLSSEYASAFEQHWRKDLGKPWTSRVAAAFSSPAVRPDDPGPDPFDEKLARGEFLRSNVGSGIDLMFGGGSYDFMSHAAAGRLVDSGLLGAHPDVFNDGVVPASLGGEPYWDQQGRWVGACLSGFGICYNRDSLARLGGPPAPAGFADLASPRYLGQVALADPSKSGSAGKAFEMIVQQQMSERLDALTREGVSEPERALRAPREGWERAMQLIRRMGANARYFTDSASKIPLDVAVGDAAMGTCIDYYGRFQSEAVSPHGSARMGFVTPPGGTSMGSDPIGLLRGAPHRELALEFMEFVMSLEGQKLWGFKVGTPGGPVRYALRRLPIRPELYAPAYDAMRSDPQEHPYQQAQFLTYRAAWTSSLFRALAFVVRVMCVDTEQELTGAYRALIEAKFPPRALALFDDVAAVDYSAASGPIRAALASPDPKVEAALATDLASRLRAQYLAVTRLAAEER